MNKSNAQIWRRKARKKRTKLKRWSQNATTNSLRSQFATTKNLSKIRTLPYAFTRNGIGMLSSVLGSETAVAMNIRIMRAFTASQQIMENHAILYKRVVNLEQHQHVDWDREI